MPDSSQKETTPALRRAAKILDLIAETGEPVSMSHLAKTLGLPKSSVHGLCSAMLDLGLLIRQDTNRFRLGPHVMRWASSFLGQLDIVSEFNALVTEANVLNDYTVTLSILEGAEVVYLACRNNAAPLGVTFRPGMHLPAAFTATGKAMLASFRNEDIERHFLNIKDFEWPLPYTSNSIRSLSEFIKEAEQTRLCGFSVDNGQVREGMYCFGACVRDSSGRVTAGIALSVLSSKINKSLVSVAGQTTLSLAQELSKRLGYLNHSAF